MHTSDRAPADDAGSAIVVEHGPVGVFDGPSLSMSDALEEATRAATDFEPAERLVSARLPIEPPDFLARIVAID